MAKTVAMSASRALGLLIAKCKLNESFIFNTYTTLYDSLLLVPTPREPRGIEMGPRADIATVLAITL
jgi:hypothetical protein